MSFSIIRRSMLASLVGMVLAATPVAAADTEIGRPLVVPVVHYQSLPIEGVEVFYREAGPSDAPVVLLLHGFPTSSHMFRNLIPLLADRYHVIAPDYPGFGYSDAPDHEAFAYTRSPTMPTSSMNSSANSASRNTPCT
jgi:predicted dienelactone hydrolase